MFIDANAKVELRVYWKKIKSRYEALSNLEYSKLKTEEKKKYTVFNVKVVELTWELYNQLQDDAMEGEDRRWNFKKFKENKLKRVIKEWDAKDEKGNPILVNDSNILKLAPAIAEAIIRSYDEISFLTEEEEKNL